MELRANPKGKAEGVVIESKIEQGEEVLLQQYLFKQALSKKVKAWLLVSRLVEQGSLMSSFGEDLKSGGPSAPVQFLV